MCSSRRSRAALAGAMAVACVCAAMPAQAQKPSSKDDSYEVLYPRYLQAARAMTQDNGSSIRWMTNLGSDFRARDVNDLVTIRVVESIVASGSADTSLAKKSDGTASLTNFFGLESKLPAWLDPTNLMNTSSNTDFKGGGTTTRSGTLTAVLTARVVEVLPNGDLMLEGVREIDINGDRQVVVLSGVVRRADLLPDNSVPSPLIGQLRIRYFGQGLIKDNLKPGWLIRVLNKIF
jgi:flagellar L-ring protein precursor FlgH